VILVFPVILGFFCVTLLLYYTVVFRLEHKHNNGMTFLPDLELKNSLFLALICSGNG
jgi:hypothetical protein